MKKYDLGNKIKTFRKLRNMSQLDLAKKMNVSRTLITHYENNVVMPPIAALQEIAILTGRKMEDFFTLDFDTGTTWLENYDGEGKIAINNTSLAGVSDIEYLRYKEVQSTDLEPAFYFGDILVIELLGDRQEDFIKENGAYLVEIEEEKATIKNVQFLPHNHLKLSSFDGVASKDLYPHQLGYKAQIIAKVCGKISFMQGFKFRIS